MIFSRDFHGVFHCIFMVFPVKFSLGHENTMKNPWKNHELCTFSWLMKYKDFVGFFMTHADFEKRPWKSHDLGFMGFSWPLWTRNLARPWKTYEIFSWEIYGVMGSWNSCENCDNSWVMNLFLSFLDIFMVHNHGSWKFHGVLSLSNLGHEKPMKFFSWEIHSVKVSWDSCDNSWVTDLFWSSWYFHGA